MGRRPEPDYCPEADRTPLHVDELHSFSGEGNNFAKILSEAREYKLGCWLSTQYLNQLDRDMRRAVTNNCRTKLFFSPSGSEDVAQITGMLHDIDREQLTAFGKYRAAVQRPATGEHMPAVIFDTYPPWTADHAHAEDLKQQALADYPPFRDRSHAVTGQKGDQGDIVGKEDHAALLKAAHERFTAEGYTVNILHQELGAAKPDTHLITEDGDRIHLEAESQTLSAPAKALQNVQQAAAADRDLVCVVAAGNGPKLANILTDPVNRRGTTHEDDQGSYSYYMLDGDPFTATGCVDEVDYTIYEHRGDGCTGSIRRPRLSARSGRTRPRAISKSSVCIVTRAMGTAPS